MTALWVFAATVTMREGLNLLSLDTVTNEVGKPTELLVEALQSERKISVLVLSGDRQRDALAAARSQTDQAVAAWRGHVHGEGLGLRFALTDRLRERVGQAAAALDRLAEVREDVDRARVSRTEAVSEFANMIDAGFAVYGAISGIDDEEIAKQSRALVTLSRARELLAKEDSLLAGVLVDGKFQGQDIAEFGKLVGAQRFLYDSTSIDLPSADLATYQQVASGPAVAQLRALEDTVIATARPGAEPRFTASAWHDAVNPALSELRRLELSAADHTVENAVPAAVGVIVRLALAGGLGLIAVIAAIVISITTARGLVRQLERLREAARDLAENKLPNVVARLSAGETVDVATDAPPLDFGDDEIGQVGKVFNVVQDTAVRAAVQQAELRHGVRDVFLSLARRTQNLVHKQLTLLDAIERRQTDADEMEDLFKIDHLASRMRRNAENLIILSGATPGRTWRRAVPMVDVIRGALGEVEDYTRITLLPVEPAALVGKAVGDVIHLLAELIENAVSYSPPYVQVNVSGQWVANGFVVEIEDRGLGMSDQDLEIANRQLVQPPDFSLADTTRLGHYVVGKLANRHGIAVQLRHSPYGGTVAIVRIPPALLETQPDSQHDHASAPGTPTAVAGLLAALPGKELAQGSMTTSGSSQTGSAELLPQHLGPMWQESGQSSNRPVATRDADFQDGGEPVQAASGLPMRVRQARRNASRCDDAGTDDCMPPARDPEQVRQMMRSYQGGTLRGRSESAGGDQKG